MATLNYYNTVISPTGGINAASGMGMDYNFTLSLTGASGGEVTITLTDTLTGFQTQLGAGNVTSQIPSYIFTFNEKVYALAGPTAYFTALEEPNVWNDPNGAGNGFETMSNQFSTSESLAAMAPYQGNVGFIFRRLVQIWHMDDDPALNDLVQTLPNIGTVAPLSVQPVGDMDIYMLADNGVRSVRVRDASNNAILADVGTPIDAIVTALLATLTDAQKATACGIIEPSSNRYWCYIPNADGSAGKIYTFSYFPSSQVAAWGSYAPTYQVAIAAPATNYSAGIVTYTGLTIGNRYAWFPGAHEVSITCGSTVIGTTAGVARQGAFIATATTAVVTSTGATVTYTGSLSLTTSFVPTKFCVFNGQIWARAGNMLLQYGGTDNNSYDNCGINWQMPFQDGQTPATLKQFNGIDVSFSGSWQISACADYLTQRFRLVYDFTSASFIRQSIGYVATGTHYSLSGVEASNGYAVFSSAMMHLKIADEK